MKRLLALAWKYSQAVLSLTITLYALYTNNIPAAIAWLTLAVIWVANIQYREYIEDLKAQNERTRQRLYDAQAYIHEHCIK